MAEQKDKKKRGKRKGGHRPSPYPALTREVIDALIVEIRAVFYAKWAIENIGFRERVLYKWLQRGEEEIDRMESDGRTRARESEAIYVALVWEMRRAKAQNVKAHSVNLQRGGLGQPAQYLTDKAGAFVRDQQGDLIQLQPAIPPSWQASARYLEAVAHAEFGRKIRQEITTPDEGGGPSELRITVVKKRNIKRGGDP